jgi:hypothetical protein
VFPYPQQIRFRNQANTTPANYSPSYLEKQYNE